MLLIVFAKVAWNRTTFSSLYINHLFLLMYYTSTATSTLYTGHTGQRPAAAAVTLRDPRGA